MEKLIKTLEDLERMQLIAVILKRNAAIEERLAAEAMWAYTLVELGLTPGISYDIHDDGEVWEQLEEETPIV
mgnify:CR=1 FL=1